MRLAVIDPHDNVLIAWPTVAEAHTDLADMAAARLAPRRWHSRKRARIAAELRAHLLELQHQTIRL